MQAQAHNTAWTRALLGVTGLQNFFLTENEQHSTGIQIDIEGTTTGLAVVTYTPIGAVDPTIQRTPTNSTVDNTNGLIIWPIKLQRLWIDLTLAGTGPFNVLVIGFKA